MLAGLFPRVSVPCIVHPANEVTPYTDWGYKNDGGVPLAAENWTQKDRGKNEIWGLKDRIL